MSLKKQPEQNNITRPPVVVVMGHVDHGKSTLLDYIRKTNVTETEAGGITQNISAYEVIHKDEGGQDKKITFLDTPGHEAFTKMRERGARIADIAILIVSAEDGVKPQTVEAWKTINMMKTPAIVAINKIDKPGADIERTKISLAENEIYLENYGGKIPFAEISAKTGTGVENLLSLILILAEVENFTANLEEEATGFVVEAHQDSKLGIQATLIIKNGTLKKGMCLAVEDAICPLRLIQNFKGEMVDQASPSMPIRLSGFDKLPAVGAAFKTFKNKKAAQEYAEEFISSRGRTPKDSDVRSLETGSAEKKIIPIVLKAAVAGTLEAIEKEIEKINKNAAAKNAVLKIITKGVGPITESDIKNVADPKESLIIGFSVKADKNAVELAETKELAINFFDIIYKMTEWLEEELERRRPRVETIETTGKARIIRAFSRTKERQIVGGKVTEGKLILNGTVKIIRRDFEIGKGKIVNLEKSKVKTGTVEEGSEFGMMLESKMEVAPGDVIELFSVEQR